MNSKTKYVFAALASLMFVSPAAAEPTLGQLISSLYPSSTLVEVDTSNSVWFNAAIPVGGNALVKYAGHNSTFGYYSSPATTATASNYTQLLPTTGVFSGSGQVSGLFVALSLPSPFAWGLRDVSTGDYWSSYTPANSDGSTHVKTYLVTAGQSAGDYVLFFEDLPKSTWSGGEPDYNDLVVQVHGFAPVPVPAPPALILMGVGGMIVCGARLRQRKPV